MNSDISLSWIYKRAFVEVVIGIRIFKIGFQGCSLLQKIRDQTTHLN